MTFFYWKKNYLIRILVVLFGKLQNAFILQKIFILFNSSMFYFKSHISIFLLESLAF